MKFTKVVAVLSMSGLLCSTAGIVSADSAYSSAAPSAEASGSYYSSSPNSSNPNLNVSTDNNSRSSSNAQGNLNQAGSLVNTQINNYALGRSIVGNGVADCSSDGLAVSAYGAGNGPFDSGSIGGTFTYTHSFGMSNCKAYAKTQLGRARLETCLLLISNYAQMSKVGLEVDYKQLQGLTNIDCPTVSFKPSAPALKTEYSPAQSPVPIIGGGELPPASKPPIVRGLW
jgi:hypothetical protein